MTGGVPHGRDDPIFSIITMEGNHMTTIEKVVDDWMARINDLMRQNELLQSGKIRIGEKRLEPDGTVSDVDTTQQSIERNEKWIADLEALLARKRHTE
jgi:hypothetical protein